MIEAIRPIDGATPAFVVEKGSSYAFCFMKFEMGFDGKLRRKEVWEM